METQNRLYSRPAWIIFLLLLLTPLSCYASCGEPATLISSIQGSAATSTLVGQTHTVEAIVTGIFQANDQLQGFFLQEESHDFDKIETSSEGIFVFHKKTPVLVGQILRLTADVQERFGQTQLVNARDINLCSRNSIDLTKPTQLKLPLKNIDSLEALEGMLVNIEQNVVVTSNLDLARFGEFVISHEHSLSSPTQIYLPGKAANALGQLNELNQLIIDDGRYQKNPTHIPYPAPGLSAINTLRVGDKPTGITGVLAYAYKQYRIHPTHTFYFEQKNARPLVTLKTVHNGKMDANGKLFRIAIFNVENYFNGDGNGDGFPSARGADSISEFKRQSIKLTKAIAGLNADIIGLAELENDGYGDKSTIATLTKLINLSNKAAKTTYQFINPGTTILGGDLITVGLLYNPDRVGLIGKPLTLSAPPFDLLSRQPLLQTFSMKHTDVELTVVMNHFKSKSCQSAKGIDKDQHDGQGCFNITRLTSAKVLSKWIKTVAPSSHLIILGDLNSYAKEEPIQSLIKQGFNNNLNRKNDYTFRFQGQGGVLDYALYSDSLKPYIEKIQIWHINADEPHALDYNEELKTESQIKTLFNDDPYRSSDHDPVYMDLRFD